MKSSRTIDEDDPHVLDPIKRVVDFSDTLGVAMMTSLLRRAWMQKPPEEEITSDTFDPWLRALHARSREDDELVDDWKTVDTPLRTEIVAFWKMVQSDVLHFLHGASGTVGELLDVDVLVLRETGGQDSDDGTPNLREKEFGGNVLLTPAFLKEGTIIRITRNKTLEDGTIIEKDVHNFDLEAEPFENLFLRRGLSYNFYGLGVLSICTLKMDKEVKFDVDSDEEDDGDDEE